MKRSHSLALLVLGICFFTRFSFAEFYGDPALGLADFKEDRHGASFYVPVNYDPKTDWPLVVVLYSDEAEKGKIFVEKWLSEIKKRNSIALFISYLNPREMPFGSDERTFKILHEIKRRYSIASDKVLLTAFGEAAHYALYLGFRYPSEFRAVGLIGGGAEGRYKPFLNYSDEKAKNIAFLILYGSKDLTINKSSFIELHKRLTGRGHNIEMEEFENLDHRAHPELIAKMMDWFDALPLPAKNQNMQQEDLQAGFGSINFVSNLVRNVFKS